MMLSLLVFLFDVILIPIANDFKEFVILGIPYLLSEGIYWDFYHRLSCGNYNHFLWFLFFLLNIGLLRFFFDNNRLYLNFDFFWLCNVVFDNGFHILAFLNLLGYYLRRFNLLRYLIYFCQHSFRNHLWGILI